MIILQGGTLRAPASCQTLFLVTWQSSVTLYITHATTSSTWTRNEVLLVYTGAGWLWRLIHYLIQTFSVFLQKQFCNEWITMYFQRKYRVPFSQELGKPQVADTLEGNIIYIAVAENVIFTSRIFLCMQIFWRY